MHLLNIILALSGLYLFFIAAVAAGKKLTLRDRVAALETLFRTEMYLLQEKVKQIQEETNYYIKSLNETIENVGAYGSGLGSIQSEDELKSETRDLKLVSVEFDEIKQKFEYLRKGVAKEKKARKENSRILMTRIEQTEEKHISLSMAFERFKNASNSDATKRKEEFNDHLKEYEQLKKKVVEKEQDGTICSNAIEEMRMVIEALNQTVENTRTSSLARCSDSNCLNGGTCVNHGGEYQCLCENGYTGIDCSETVEGTEMIIFTKVPKSRVLRRHSVHIEECQATTTSKNLAIQYQWTFNDEIVGPEHDSAIIYYFGDGLLMINEFTPELEGRYSCTAHVENGPRSIVFFEYTLLENCPNVILKGPTDSEKALGTDIIMPCYAPTAVNVTWWKDNVLVNIDQESRFEKMANNFLRITKLQDSDSGTYRCEAINQNMCLGSEEANLSVVKRIPLNQYCGRTIYDDVVSSRISSGKNARPAEYPWTVFIRGFLSSKGDIVTIGVGSLISQSWVLTTATDIVQFPQVFSQNFSSSSVKLHFGVSNCACTDGVIRRPKRFIIHDKYDTEARMDSDIALIELDIPIEYTDTIKPICIEHFSYNTKVLFDKIQHGMTFGKVASCGQDYRRRFSPLIMEVVLPLVEQQECQAKFDELVSLVNLNMTLTPKMLCAGSGRRRSGDTCRGDGGAALVMTDSERWIQVGMSSFGFGCDRGYYGVYTNVGQFFDWIKYQTNINDEYVIV